ncbi:uncharacterized protein [Physcomitrium patens]|uniref:uncharacterized protein n=1 Tax=Physcomitrium patens TaxID=3218 RepID=UPI000D152200|nr:COMM domain-containing protein 3-like [Physcomitrium patens]|eukprot:XP_024370384.1 COMM domain-containing protein 3-like [Physcomitrella patens]
MAMEEVEIDIEGDVVESLRSIANCSDAEIEAFAGAAQSVLLSLQREDAALDGPIFEQIEVDLIKKLYSALACLFVEAAKSNASEGSLVKFLSGRSGVSESQAEIVARIFVDGKERLRKDLSRTGDFSSISRLKGVDWRLEYRVASGDEGEEQGTGPHRAPPRRDLLYHVVLKTGEKVEGGEANGQAAFACSVEQLQDMVSTLKDACKAVERIVYQGEAVTLFCLFFAQVLLIE